MEIKKATDANLEKNRGVFIQMGFLITLSLVLIAFEWSSSEVIDISDLPISSGVPIDIDIIRTYRKDKIHPPPPKIAEAFIIKEDTADLQHLFIPPDPEIDIESIIWTPPEYIEPEAKENQPFVIAECMPKFQGGDLTMFWKFLQSEMTYPEVPKKLGIEGTVIVQFIVNEEGIVTQVTVQRSIDPYLDKEAVRVISSSPKWEPGMQAGKTVPVIFTIPIRFQLK